MGMRMSHGGEVSTGVRAVSLWSDQIRYLLQYVWLSHTCIALHYHPSTNPGQEMDQPKARVQRAPSLNLGIHSEVCFHAGRFRVISEVQQIQRVDEHE